MLNTFMAKSTDIVKRKSGRPVVIGKGAGEFVALRLPPEMIEAVDSWAARNKKASRSAAMRALIERGLKR